MYFIGAGPGDPELLTLRGRRLIGEADLLLYADSLVSPEILRFARPEAEVVATAELTLETIVERALAYVPTVLRAALLAAKRPEKARVIGDLGHGRHRAARRAAAGALLDCQDRREPVNEIHVRPLELLEGLACVPRQALHVFPVALGVDRIERQR